MSMGLENMTPMQEKKIIEILKNEKDNSSKDFVFSDSAMYNLVN